jgi:serine phosphatase RsbU (regulator of sigma subunit)
MWRSTPGAHHDRRQLPHSTLRVPPEPARKWLENVGRNVARGVHLLPFVNFSAPSSTPTGSTGSTRVLAGFRIVAESRALGARAGGDFWIARASEPGRLAVVIGDACGHGASAAALLQHLMPAARELSRFGAGPGWLLWELNRRLQQRLAIDRFITAAAFELDLYAGRLWVANAGHVPALLRHASGGVSVIGRPSGPPLGMAKRTDYAEERYGFSGGDVLVTMTDGVFEAVESDLMGMRTLRHVVALAGEGSRAVQRAVLGRLDNAAAGQDDMTLVTLEVAAAMKPLHRHYEQVA